MTQTEGMLTTITVREKVILGKDVQMSGEEFQARLETAMQKIPKRFVLSFKVRQSPVPKGHEAT